MRKRLSTVATALTATAGLTLLVMAATAMVHERATPRDFGATSAPPSHTGAPTPNGRETAPAAPVPGSKRLASRRPMVPEVPVALAIPALHTQAAVVPVTTTAGQLGYLTIPCASAGGPEAHAPARRMERS